MASALNVQARANLGFTPTQKLTSAQANAVNAEVRKLSKQVPTANQFNGTNLAPADIAAGITPQSLQRNEAFREILRREQRGEITLEQANQMRQEADRNFPSDTGTQVLFNQAQEGLKARDLSSMETPSQPTGGTGSGQTSFNTGNAKTDKFLNEVWLPYIESVLSGNPQALMSEDAFNKIVADAEAKFKPAYGVELSEAQQTFARNQQEVGAQKTDFEKQQELAKTRSLEDLATGKQRIARNYNEAMKDSQDSMAARNLTFGGSRLREERKLGEGKTLDEQALQTTSNRTLEDLQRESTLKLGETGTGGQFGRQLSELEQGYGATQRQLGSQYEQGTQGYIAAEQAKKQAEQDRMLGLASDLLQNRNLLPQ